MKILILKSLAIILIGVNFIACKNETKNIPVHKENNAIWSESIYLRGYNPSTKEILTEDYIKEFCNKLNKYHIRYVFLFAGPFDTTGHLPEYPFSDIAIKSIQLFKQFAPETMVLPWIGGVQNKSIFLDDSIWVRNALADTKRLVETLRVEGVQMDFEFIIKEETFFSSTMKEERPQDYETYGDNVNAFHSKLRALMPSSFLSSVVTATCKDSQPWKRKTTIPELQGLLKNIDQICFLFFDTKIKDKVIFQSNCDQFVEDIKTLKSKFENVKYLIALGTFVNDPRLQHYRDMSIENIPNTINVIKNSLNKISPKDTLLEGLSIYCDWQTDTNEWHEFDKNWNTNGISRN